MKPYFSTYPGPFWYWFDVAVYGKHVPHIGDLPTAVFERLTGGVRVGAYRRYSSEAEARQDLQQAQESANEG